MALGRAARWTCIGFTLTLIGLSACADERGADVGAAEDTGTVFLIRQSGEDRLLFEDLVAARRDLRATTTAARIVDALTAASQPTDEERKGGLIAPLSRRAIPAVKIEDRVVVLDWDSRRAAAELAAWGTSSGSTGLWPILGVVFENAEAVRAIEHRLDGSCQRFTERLQGAGCDRNTRSQWNGYKAG